MAVDLEKLTDSPHLLDILMQMEDVLDANDVYVFPNWFSGEIVEGPIVRRYWFDMTLRYPLDKQPDPQAARRLIRLGVRVDFDKITISDDKAKDGEDPEPTHCEVRISIPSRLISAMNSAELDFYDEVIDVDDVEDAQDSGVTDESAYETDGEQDIESPNAGSNDTEEPGDVAF